MIIAQLLVLFHVMIVVVIQARAGGYDGLPSRDIDVSAFSYSKKTVKSDPKEFIKKHSGFGGTLVSLYYRCLSCIV